ncbi:MAG: FKBP-type peptidyl-prolyl cis-trans isomerase [Mucilaginibacter sp.]
MKQTVFTLLLISVIGLVSCRKKGVDLNIRQYDDQQIQNYMAAHGLTGVMTRDTYGGDTTGMYYQIIVPGNTSQPLSDTSRISMVFTLKSFDGLYTSTDTINNHFFNYIGHIATAGLPAGLRIALLNDLKYNGGSMRLLIPSRMAYGLYGNGSGSTQNANSHIAGNQCLDYYVHVINNQTSYDSLVMVNYMKAQNLTGYTPVTVRLPANYVSPTRLPSHYCTYFYKVEKPGTGTSKIDSNSIVEATYTGQLLNGVVFDAGYNGADSTSLQVPNLILGVQDGLTHVHGGGSLISLILPSALCYGQGGATGIPSNSCLRFSFEIYSVTP